MIVTPNSFALSTTSKALPHAIKGGRSGLFLANDIRSSLHLPVFNWNRFNLDHSTTSSTISCAWLIVPLGMVSDTVVSSTYFHKEAFLIFRSFIIITNSQGPNLVPWGTPEGTESHSEKHPALYKLIRCWRFDKKSMTQLIMLTGKFRDFNLLTNIPWSMRSNAFL